MIDRVAGGGSLHALVLAVLDRMSIMTATAFGNAIKRYSTPFLMMCANEIYSVGNLLPIDFGSAQEAACGKTSGLGTRVRQLRA